MILTEKLPVIVKAGITYFGLVFGVGFMIGPIRVLLVEPQVGDRLAELVEAPLMLAVMILAARWVIRWFDVPKRLSVRFSIGGLALVLGLLLELTLVLQVRGLTLAEYVASRDAIAGMVYYLLLILFALLPALIDNPFRRESIS